MAEPFASHPSRTPGRPAPLRITGAQGQVGRYASRRDAATSDGLPDRRGFIASRPNTARRGSARRCRISCRAGGDKHVLGPPIHTPPDDVKPLCSCRRIVFVALLRRTFSDDDDVAVGADTQRRNSTSSSSGLSCSRPSHLHQRLARFRRRRRRRRVLLTVASAATGVVLDRRHRCPVPPSRRSGLGVVVSGPQRRRPTVMLTVSYRYPCALGRWSTSPHVTSRVAVITSGYRCEPVTFTSTRRV